MSATTIERMRPFSSASPLDFVLDPAHEAHEPPEARGIARDEVRLLVSPGDGEPVDTSFDHLDDVLRAGDLVVVNTSATLPAALDGVLPDGRPVAVHYSGALPGGLSLVEVRRRRGGLSLPLRLADPVRVALDAGGHVDLLAPFATSSRMWLARVVVDAPTVVDHLLRSGRPIRYPHVTRDWPLACYQTVFALEPGSAEMPSASRPFSSALVTRLAGRGVQFAPLVLHTGVSSLEGNEAPYPEQYRVPRPTAAAVNAAHAAGNRVLAAGTTVVRALVTVTDDLGIVHPGEGWTDVVVTASTPLPAVDGLITGWHEPESSHLLMLQAFASPDALRTAYGRALALGYRWHEFGDSHLILREARAR
jgi:S-adenosylmethionine:tRNA ribosyltransferase-isomerase